jgi:hypothetical protein
MIQLIYFIHRGRFAQKLKKNRAQNHVEPLTVFFIFCAQNHTKMLSCGAAEFLRKSTATSRISPPFLTLLLLPSLSERIFCNNPRISLKVLRKD